MALLPFQDGPFFEGRSLWLLFLFAAICIFGGTRLRSKIDPREPPLVRPKIPVIGHIIGLVRHNVQYVRLLSRENPDLPVFTLPLGTDKMYIIASPQMIPHAFRNKSLDLHPLVAEFAKRMVGFGPNLQHLLQNPPRDGSIKWLDDQHKAYEALSPGPALHEMNSYVLNSISDILDDIGNDFETKTIYLWLRDSFTKASVGSLFGAKSSLMNDPTLGKYLWDFEGGQLQLLLQPFPSITARRAYQGRVKVQQALRKYFREEFDFIPDVSKVVRNRVAINKKWGLQGDDLADHEVGMLFVSVTNAIPTLFWTIIYVFRDSSLVADLQEELMQIVEDKVEENCIRQCTFNISEFSSACPLLIATYREVMRLTNRQSGTREVAEDTILDYTPIGDNDGPRRSYLLKKGVKIQMPSTITHYAEATWGTNAHEFDPRRFITSRERERQQNKAFNPFGGGKHLCPGRFFADAEILGTIAALVLGFEIESPKGGKVTLPAINTNMAEAVGKPLQSDQQKYLARIRRRPGWENVKWKFRSGNEKS